MLHGASTCIETEFCCLQCTVLLSYRPWFAPCFFYPLLNVDCLWRHVLSSSLSCFYCIVLFFIKSCSQLLNILLYGPFLFTTYNMVSKLLLLSQKFFSHNKIIFPSSHNILDFSCANCQTHHREKCVPPPHIPIFSFKFFSFTSFFIILFLFANTINTVISKCVRPIILPGSTIFLFTSLMTHML